MSFSYDMEFKGRRTLRQRKSQNYRILHEFGYNNEENQSEQLEASLQLSAENASKNDECSSLFITTKSVVQQKPFNYEILKKCGSASDEYYFKKEMPSQLSSATFSENDNDFNVFAERKRNSYDFRHPDEFVYSNADQSYFQVMANKVKNEPNLQFMACKIKNEPYLEAISNKNNNKTPQIIPDVSNTSGQCCSAVSHEKSFKQHKSCGYRNTNKKSNSNNANIRKKLHSSVENFICNICDKSFGNKDNLKRHVLIHSNVKNYKCDSCDVSFYRVCDFYKHSVIHKGIKKYSCDICKRHFRRKYHLVSHFLTHSTSSHVCRLCNAPFTKLSFLVDHIINHDN